MRYHVIYEQHGICLGFQYISKANDNTRNTNANFKNGIRRDNNDKRINDNNNNSNQIVIRIRIRMRINAVTIANSNKRLITTT